jgi:hypothetical protein
VRVPCKIVVVALETKGDFPSLEMPVRNNALGGGQATTEFTVI